MKTEQAKEWLSAYLEGLEFEDIPELKEALQMVETDAELREWWKRQKQLDATMEAGVRSVPIPEDLEDRLLQTVGAGSKRSGHRFRRLAWVAGIAAALVIGVGTLYRLNPHEGLVQDIQYTMSGTSPDNFVHFRDGMSYYIRNVYFQLDHLTGDLDSIENWLEKKDSPTYEMIPEELLALDPIGCKKLKWKGMDVSLVCFHSEDGGIVHMFVLDRDNAAERHYSGIEAVATSHGLETGGWQTDQAIYILVGSDPDVDVEFALLS